MSEGGISNWAVVMIGFPTVQLQEQLAVGD
jgi:hypothetical protein